MALADHSQEERDRICEAFIEIVNGPFVPADGESHACQSLRQVFLQVWSFGN